MNYKIIADQEEIERFIQWLPALGENDCFYVSILARAKYAGGALAGAKSDKKQIGRFVTTPNRLVDDLRRYEVPLGTYKRQGVEIPQDAIAAYITPNPRSMQLATVNLAKVLFERICEGKTVNVVEAALTEAHKAVSRKAVIDFDFDGVELDGVELAKHVNVEAANFVKTRGGYHLLVWPSRVNDAYRKTWYKAISGMNGVDVVGESMLPIPGTYQGGYIPRLYSIA